jgi:aspartate racemase
MKRIGIIGGLGPESTLDYYKGIIGAFNTKYPDLGYPEIIIYSAELKKLLRLVRTENWPALSDWLLGMISSLHMAGAEFAAIASNTPHIVFDKIRPKSPIPLVSIVEETCRKAREMGLKKIGLMGTKLTMGAGFYKKPFISNGISIIVPGSQEQLVIQHWLFSEIELGIIKDSTREELMMIAKRMVEEDRIDSLILGCTELPLILTESRYGIPFLNTAAIHCESIIRHCIG